MQTDIPFITKDFKYHDILTLLSKLSKDVKFVAVVENAGMYALRRSKDSLHTRCECCNMWCVYVVGVYFGGTWR